MDCCELIEKVGFIMAEIKQNLKIYDVDLQIEEESKKKN